MSFKSILRAFIRTDNPYYARASIDAPSVSGQSGGNSNAAVDSYHRLWTRQAGEPLPAGARYAPQEWQWSKRLADNQHVISNTDADRAVMLRVQAWGGDPAVQWDAAPLYLLTFYDNGLGAAFLAFSWPIPRPPYMLDVDLSKYEAPVATYPGGWDLAWSSSTTPNTVTGTELINVNICYTFLKGA